MKKIEVTCECEGIPVYFRNAVEQENERLKEQLARINSAKLP